MALLPQILLVAVAFAVVVLVPGAAVLAAVGLDRAVPPPLVPAAALAVGLVPLGAALGASLVLHRPIEVVAVALAVVTAACWGVLSSRAREEHGLRGPIAWLAPIRWLVAGTWLRATPIGVWLVAAGAAALAGVLGAHAWNDSLYHIGQAQKLLALDAPGVHDTLQFPDGSAHPGYLLPVWQEVIALTSWVAQVDPVLAAWIIPCVTVAIAAMAVGGLGWALVRHPAAAAPASLAWLLAYGVSTAPPSLPVYDSMHPGTVALDVLVPLAIAALLLALWPDDDADRHALRRTSRGPANLSRAATALVLVAIGGIAVMHITYLVVLAIGIVGYLLFWALRAPWPRAVVVRHAVVLVPVALVACALVAAILPGIMELSTYGRDAAAEIAANEGELFFGKNAVELDELLVGGTERYHLRADYLVLAGGLALCGLLLLPLASLLPRWPGGWLLAGGALVVMAIALLPALFPHYVNAVTLDQARRIEKALPLGVALGIGALGIGALAAGAWHRGWVARIVGALAAAAAAGASAFAAEHVPKLQGYDGATTVASGWVYAPLVLLAAGVLLACVLLAVRLVRGGERAAAVERRLRLAPWAWPGVAIPRGAALVACAILAVGALPLYDQLELAAASERIEGLPEDMRADELRFFDPEVADELRTLPTGSMVLADPRARLPYQALAVAPVYVVSSVPRHTASTPQNRVERRYRTAVHFHRNGALPCQRARLVVAAKVDAVLLAQGANRRVTGWLDSAPGIRLTAAGERQRLYRVDWRRLRRHACAGNARTAPGG